MSAVTEIHKSSKASSSFGTRAVTVYDPASYGVFIGGQLVATIQGEKGGGLLSGTYRQPTVWSIHAGDGRGVHLRTIGPSFRTLEKAKAFAMRADFADLVQQEAESYRKRFPQRTPNARSKKINLGFVVINTTTGEFLSDVFAKREPARAVARELYERTGAPLGVHTLDAHVPEDWKRGDSLEGYAEPRVLEKLGLAPTGSRTPNASYYVWPLDRGGLPLAGEGPWGPYGDLAGAKTFARIGATEGKHDRAVSIGSSPTSRSFQIVRAYRAGSGDRYI